MKSKLILAGLTLAAAIPTFAAVRPVRLSQSPAPASSHARISGRVLGSGSKPLAGAKVTAVAVSAPGGGVRATTDGSGHYALDVQAGTYRFRAERRGHVSAYYDLSGGEAGTPMSVDAGQSFPGIDFRLSRGGVITGRIYDEEGEPLVGVEVVALRKEGGSNYGQRQAYRVWTDDRGIYRLYTLAPGHHIVGALLVEYYPAPHEKGYQTPTRLTCFFPGVISRDQATEVSVAAGSETAGIDFKIEGPARKGTLAGKITRKDTGQILAGSIVHISSVEDPLNNNHMVVSDATGAYKKESLPFGEYNVAARIGMFQNLQGLVTPAIQTFKLASSDYEINFEFDRPAEISGRVSLEDGKTPPGVEHLLVHLVPRDEVELAGPRPNDVLAVRPDPKGAITIGGLSPGRYRFTLGSTKTVSPYFLKSVMSDDLDLIGSGVVIEGGDRLNGFVLMVSDEGGTINGFISSADGGKPMLGSTVRLLPANIFKRGSSALREQRETEGDQRGRYEFKLVPPGHYLIGAFTDRKARLSPKELLAYLLGRKSSLIKLEVKPRETRELNLVAASGVKL